MEQLGPGGDGVGQEIVDEDDEPVRVGDSGDELAHRAEGARAGLERIEHRVVDPGRLGDRFHAT